MAATEATTTAARLSHRRRHGSARHGLSSAVVTALLVISGASREPECLTGKFTDVQNWALEDGSFSHKINYSHALDLSAQPDALSQLRIMMDRSGDVNIHIHRIKHSELDGAKTDFGEEQYQWIQLSNVYFLSLARNELDRIPLFYNNASGVSGSNWNHLKYLSLYGNDFHNGIVTSSQLKYSASLNATEYEEVAPRHYFSFAKGRSNWAADLAQLQMANLLELDLRNCSILVLYRDTFKSLVKLRRLYLSENKIAVIEPGSFNGFHNLIHLDISMNVAVPLNSTTAPPLTGEGLTIASEAFRTLIRLKSLDLSHTRITQSSSKVFKELTKSVERLSLCYTRFAFTEKDMFSNMALKHFDISGNIAPEQINNNAFNGLEESLEILFANQMGIKNLQPFRNLKKLQVLALTENDIHTLDLATMKELTELRILDLSDNRITHWPENLLYFQKKLELLKLDKNNLNLLSLEMLEDFNKLKYLSLGSNSFVCNCNVKSFSDRVLELEQNYPNYEEYPDWYVNASRLLTIDTTDEHYLDESGNLNFNTAFIYYSRLIQKLNQQYSSAASATLSEEEDLSSEWDGILNVTHNFTFRLLDRHEEEYQCVDSRSSKAKPFDFVTACVPDEEKKDFNGKVGSSTLLVTMLVVIAFIVLVAAVMIWKWWYVRYFFLMMKNVAVLSIMGKDQSTEEGEKVFNYDVFVSYCDEDRKWVLNEFLPNIEGNSSISVCLHERDFEVGLSILENIISCMDRSRALLLVVSNQFLMSQWCQFEMHLAQHRLLETRREQLILVLLEDIPRRRRPNTLHYLMMTKTYIVWPKAEGERASFWRRLKKSLLHGQVSAEKEHSMA